MFIQRIEVEGGFLDGLSLQLDPGLNVLIGPRGAGKTSVIELLRFCLEVPGFTDDSDREARKHALSVLGDGRVTVTVSIDDESLQLTRSSEEERAHRSSPTAFRPPTILSQKEIELIGRDARGRLRLVDSFRASADELERQHLAARAQIASLTREMQALAQEIEGLENQVSELKDVPSLLEEATEAEAEIRKTLGQSVAEQEHLEELSDRIAKIGVQIGIVERSIDGAEGWRERLSALRSVRPTSENWPSDPEPPSFAAARNALSSVDALLAKAEDELIASAEALRGLTADMTTERISAQDEARGLRRVLDEIQQGAGAVSRRVSDLKEKSGQIEALQALLDAKHQQLRGVQETRHAALDELDVIRTKRYEERKAITDHLNTTLGPVIELRLIRDGLQTEYAGAIASSLRGSGVHYNTLAPLLAARMSPRELAESIEAGDASRVSDLGEVAPDRAQRAVAWVRQYGTHEILTAGLDDSVSIALLDGTEMKASDEVSTGQRCTAILPILLSHESQVLVIDQPEDHLDNSFIVSTVVTAILSMGTKSQLLFSTHNANIPVLGNASRVILLGSDGNRGFRVLDGPLSHGAVVNAITAIMEGGSEAFAKRAKFYASQQISV